MRISICVPWRSDEPSRVASWGAVRRTWEHLAQGIDFELSVADDGLTGPFSRALAINRAVAQSTGDIVAVHGADHLPDWPAIEQAAEVAQRRGWSMIYSLVQMLDPQETRQFIEHETLPTLTEHPVHAYVCPGLIAVRRDLWDEVGGMDERFGTGYGYEDCALRNVLAARVGADCFDDWYPSGILRGLYHVHAGQPTPENHDLFWREYANLAPELN